MMIVCIHPSHYSDDEEYTLFQLFLLRSYSRCKIILYFNPKAVDG